MKAAHFKDFGELYRAAFAERDPQLKQALLASVQKAISESGCPPQLSPGPLQSGMEELERIRPRP